MAQLDPVLQYTPLYNRHVEAGARMVNFAGWSMPLQYSGIIDEHLHTREKAGIFDICHMGEFVIRGKTAEGDLDRLLTCRMDDLSLGQCRYGFLLENGGGIIDDLIVFKVKEEEFMLVVNSATTDKDKKWIKGRLSPDTFMMDISDKTGKIDLQGPLSSHVIEKITGENVERRIGRFRFEKINIDGMNVLLSRTGYTGELGYELFFDAAGSEKIWDKLLKYDEVKPVGLGARDTLRMEMGYSLYGNDLSEEYSPLEADLAKFVYMEKDFIGKDALIKQKEDGIKTVLKGFVCEGRRSARCGFDVVVSGEKTGVVTSGGFSPSIQKGIGLCYTSVGCSEDGKAIKLTDGKIEINAIIKSPPMYGRRGSQKTIDHRP